MVLIEERPNGAAASASSKKIGPKRKRVLDAINHRVPDRVPMDFGGSAVTGMHVSCIAKLRDYYGLEKRLVKVHEPYQMLGLVEDDLKEAMGVDVTPLPSRTNMFGFQNRAWRPWTFNGLEVLVPADFRVTNDANGDTLIYPKGDVAARPSGRMPNGGFFFDSIVRQKPLDLDRLDPADNAEQYQPLTEAELDGIEEDARAVNDGRYAVFASLVNTALGDIAFVPGPDLVDPKGVRDVAEWYILTASHPEIVHKIFERQVEVGIANLARINERIGNAIDVIFLCGADFGTQTSSFCSTKTFDSLWKPHYTDLCGWIHKNTSWKIFKHSCGASERFFESMLAAGIDIINPVQCSAKGMEPRKLKDKYRGRLVFWGGGVDTQATLPFGAPEAVRAEVLERCEIFADGGGFVFDAIHNVQANTPVENMAAMIEAVKEFNGRL
jgi:hypothetical protein